MKSQSPYLPQTKPDQELPIRVVPKVPESNGRRQILYRVGKHAPGLASYPFWARWLVRVVYFITGYQVTSHDIGIASTAEKAEAMCLDSTYFYKPLYLDCPLPASECAPGPVVWPRSEAKRWYERHYPDPIILGDQEISLAPNTVISVKSIGWPIESKPNGYEHPK